MENKKRKTPKRRFAEFTDDWEERKLSDITTYRNGKGHEENQLDEGTFELVNLNSVSIDGGLKPSGKFIEDAIDTLQKNDLVMVLSDVGHGDLLGKVAIIPENNRFVLNQRVALLRITDKTIPYFLFSIINKNQLYFKREGAGSSQLNISKSSVENFIVDYPTIDEQINIAAYFCNLDHLITLHQRKLDKLNFIKKSYLSEMFPQEGEKKPKRRFKGFTDDWEQRKFSEVATMHARIGWQNLRTSEFLNSGKYMLITGTDFKDGVINYSTCHYVERERYEQDKHIQIKNGSILITKDGTLGKVAYVQGLSMPATLNAGVFNVKIKDETEVDNKYLFQYLKAPFLMDYVDKKATGGTIKHLNQNILVDFPVVMPTKAEQQVIGMYFEHLDHLITLHQRKLQKLKNIKQAYLKEMFV